MLLSRKPLPPPGQPIAGSLAPNLPYALYLQWLDAQLNALLAFAPNTQTTNYTLQLIDGDGIVEMNLAGANTLTVPPNSSVSFPIGVRVKVVQVGAGATTLTAGLGVTVRSRPSLVLKGQWAVAELYKRGTDEWVASGDLA